MPADGHPLFYQVDLQTITSKNAVLKKKRLKKEDKKKPKKVCR